ncbi:MAG: rhomboid family intramembrane serine protease [Planctomycetes bacterium]|nr:rhomboid family intramembrane serine protease [Planctomycetota bacterium]
MTSRGLDEGLVYSNAEQVLRGISWIVPTGILPVASEAMGSRRPYATWAIAVLTVFVSVWFWFSTDAQMGSRKKLMLWAGNESPSAELILEAHNALPPGQQVVGRFRWYQLGTHALLHGDIFHLAGNLLFLLIFGSRVTALIGNIATVVLYPILAVLAALAHMVSAASGEPEPMIGASGAIMGLAGMYFVLFPVNRMHMAAWFRWWFFFRLGMWAMRGFWAVLIYIAFDILYVAIGAETGVAHWAHLGGFIAGGVLALILLLCRLLNAGRGDLISVVLGRHAWKLIGRPSESDRLGLHLPRA